MLPVGPVLALLLASGSKYAVMPVAANEIVTEKSASLLTETLAAELRQQSGGDVVTPRDLGSALSVEKQKQMLGCQSDSCMAEIAGAFGADRLVASEVAQLGESLLVQIRLLDARKAKVVAQSRRRFRRGGLDDLLDALPAMIGELLSPPPPAAAAPPAPAEAGKDPEAERSPPATRRGAASPAEAAKKPRPGDADGGATARPPTRPLASTARALGDDSHEFTLAVPLARSGVMPVSLEVGPFTITELRVRNMPSEEETRDGSRGGDKSHPKPTVTARSGAKWDAVLRLKVVLEDDQAKALLSCEAKKGLSAGESEELNMCWLASIRTLDWPKVKVFRLTGKIEKD